MRFVSAAPLVRAAGQSGYAVPALNTNGAGYDIARAALEATAELRAPLILQVYEPNTAYRGFTYFVELAEHLCNELHVTIPVALQLDHGKSVASVTTAMDAGLTSVMFDASHDPLSENIRKTGEVLSLARARGVSVEAEVGYVKGNEPVAGKQTGRIPVPQAPSIPPAKTDPEEVENFLQECDVDMLAVALGTTHGVYQTQTEIDFELLRTLRDRIDKPLVMHGTSGISVEDLSRLAQGGMAKINFGEPFRYNFIRYFNALTDEMEHLWHPWRIMQEVKNRLKADMKELIVALHADGKAG
jgi:fructose-bisphosphate aldolase class II